MAPNPQATPEIHLSVDRRTQQLFRACRGRNVKRLRSLLRGGCCHRPVGVRVVNSDGDTPLHVAAQSGCVEAVRLLLQCEAPVKAPNNIGKTPLHLAAAYNGVDACNVLIHYGAPLNGRDEEGCTPLHLAVVQGNKNVVALLAAHGAQTNLVNGDGKTAWELADTNEDLQKALGHARDLPPPVALSAQESRQFERSEEQRELTLDDRARRSYQKKREATVRGATLRIKDADQLSEGETEARIEEAVAVETLVVAEELEKNVTRELREAEEGLEREAADGRKILHEFQDEELPDEFVAALELAEKGREATRRASEQALQEHDEIIAPHRPVPKGKKRRGPTRRIQTTAKEVAGPSSSSSSVQSPQRRRRAKEVKELELRIMHAEEELQRAEEEMHRVEAMDPDRGSSMYTM